MYTLDKDYTEQYTDGSGRYKKVFSKGQAISWETAKALGLVTGDEPKEEKAKKEETQAKQ